MATAARSSPARTAEKEPGERRARWPAQPESRAGAGEQGGEDACGGRCWVAMRTHVDLPLPGFQIADL